MKKRRPSKTPQFKFPTDDRSTQAARDRLRVLKTRFGVAFGFPINAKLTPQRKAAITRTTRKYVEFLNPANGFVFVPAKPATVRALRKKGEVSRAQITTKGAFLPVPGGKKKSTARIKRDGTVETTTGKFSSTFKQFKATDVVRDPMIVLRAAKKAGAERVFISIKGHRGGKRKNGYSVAAFMRYVREIIAPDIEAAQEDEEIEVEGRAQKSAFKNTVGVEFVRYKWKK